jgi:IS6 family transposase
MKKAKLLPERCRLRQSQYMNNLIEQDRRFMKRQIRPGLGFGSFPTAYKTIQGYEVMNMIRKGQMEGIEKGNIKEQNRFIAKLFGLGV